MFVMENDIGMQSRKVMKYGTRIIIGMRCTGYEEYEGYNAVDRVLCL